MAVEKFKNKKNIYNKWLYHNFFLFSHYCNSCLHKTDAIIAHKKAHKKDEILLGVVMQFFYSPFSITFLRELFYALSKHKVKCKRNIK